VEEELQRQRRLAASRHTLEQEKGLSRNPVGEDLVQAENPEVSSGVTVVRHLASLPPVPVIAGRPRGDDANAAIWRQTRLVCPHLRMVRQPIMAFGTAQAVSADPALAQWQASLIPEACG
jgi:hypothetical protein